MYNLSYWCRFESRDVPCGTFATLADALRASDVVWEREMRLFGRNVIMSISPCKD